MARACYTGNELYQYAAGTAYTGSGKSLRQAVSEQGWPLLSALTGKVIVAYTGGKIGLTNQTQGGGIDYIAAQSPPRLPYGFFCPDVESNPDELNPGGTVDGMSSGTSQYAVCSNLAAQDNYQVTANRAAQHHQISHIWGDHVYSTDSFVYNYIAVAHGISAIGRNSAPTDTFGGAIPPVGVRRSLPGYFELRPQSAPTKCMDVNGSGSSNGTKIQVWSCGGTSNQRFVYTAEGQLRPQHANPTAPTSAAARPATTSRSTCGTATAAAAKWLINADGSFKSSNNQAYCLDAASGSSTNGAQFVTKSCSSASSQKFTLQSVADWLQTSF